MKLFAAALLFFAVLSGCVSQSNGLAELKEIELRYMGRGTIAPATITDIDLMAEELRTLSQKSLPPVQEMIGIRVDLLSFSRNYLEAQKTMLKISPIKGGCGEQDPLKKAISQLNGTLDDAPAIKARLSGFRNNRPQAYAESNLSVEDFDQFAETISNLQKEMRVFYNQACVQ